MKTTLDDLKKAVDAALREHGAHHEVAVYNSAGDQITAPIAYALTPSEDGWAVELL